MSLDHPLLSGLNAQQAAAVVHGEGPLLIFAGAGSGKTRVLTHRIAYLIAEHGVRPHEILAVTFTNKAAGEMRERVEQLVHNTRGMWIGTFHSMCARVLRQGGEAIGISPDFSIYDTADQEALAKDAVSELNLDSSDVANKPRALLTRISNAKNELLSPEEFARTASGFADQVVARVYRAYQRRLDLAHALDFDDLIRCTVLLFDRHPNVLEQWRGRFRHVLVDEYQDINYAQYVFVTRLASAHGNICVVGDDDQSIYRWRGADVRLILQFEKDFPTAHVVKLEQNYRSTQRILDVAYGVIRNNTHRAEKRLWTERGAGEKVRCYEAVDERQEADWIARQIRERRAAGDRYSETAVLYRTNAQSRVLEETLRDAGLPYRLVGGVRFYDRMEIKDVLAYLRLMYNPFDVISLRRCINTPPRGIGPTAVGRLEELADQEGATAFECLMRLEQYKDRLGRSFPPLMGFAALLRALLAKQEGRTVAEVIGDVVNESGYRAALKAERSPEAEGRLENLMELQTAAQKYAEEADEPSLGGFLEHVSLVSDVDALDSDADAVTLMTLHAAKGLEFDTVFIAGVEEGVFPHQRSLFDEHELAEERRLCYVGVTRARERVTLVHARQRSMFGQTQANRHSRFIDEIPTDQLERETAAALFRATLSFDLGAASRPTRRLDLSDVVAKHKRAADTGGTERRPDSPCGTVFSPGDRVKHSTFGVGVVVGAEPGFVQVAFQDKGVRKLALDYAPLTKM